MYQNAFVNRRRRVLYSHEMIVSCSDLVFSWNVGAVGLAVTKEGDLRRHMYCVYSRNMCDEKLMSSSPLLHSTGFKSQQSLR